MFWLEIDLKNVLTVQIDPSLNQNIQTMHNYCILGLIYWFEIWLKCVNI